VLGKFVLAKIRKNRLKINKNDNPHSPIKSDHEGNLAKLIFSSETN